MTKIVTAASPQREQLTDSQANSLALGVIGYHFTTALIAWLKNPKIADFRDDAESCFLKVEKRAKAWGWLAFWVGLTIGFLGIAVCEGITRGFVEAFFHGWLMQASAIIGVLTLIIAFFYGFGYELGSNRRPGDTTRMVAKMWKPWRKKIVSSGVLSDFASTLKWRYKDAETGSILLRQIASYSFGGSELEIVLKSTLANLADEAVKNFQDEVLDGSKRGQQRHRQQFGQIDKIGQELGFEKLDWKRLDS
ncbi:MAG: hypothetical protein WC711_01170 [Candidatus Staskawiczbacteria bacterium]|jgi:hypothetical protein